MHAQSTHRVPPPVDPPSYQRFRSIDDPDIPDSIKYLLIRRLNPNEHIVLWEDIEDYFPHAHIILNGNTLVTKIRGEDLLLAIPVRIEANTAAVYLVVMNPAS